MLSLSFGTTCGWSGPNYIVLTSNETALASGALTISEGSLVVSLLSVGGLIGTVFYSFMNDRYNRKILLSFMAVSQIVLVFVLNECLNKYM